jgi:sulfite exporter TauE/SafE
VVPVAGFLAGKLLSHVILGAALGGLGSTFQLSFSSRATLQILAGAVMLVLAADLLGVKAVRRVIPRPPDAWGRLVRRSGRFGGALGPGVLGFATVLIPCGVTLSMEFLAVASGSPASGAAVMGVFLLGTSPLFATLGYVARRSSTALRGRLAFLAGVAVVVAALLSINAGLTVSGSSFTLSSAWRSISSSEEAPVSVVAPATDGTQRVVITVRSAGYSPSRLQARANVPTTLVLQSRGADGCTSAIVFPSLGVEKILPEDGETLIDVGPLPAGKHRFTCAMGMYTGVIEATA